MGTQTYDCSVPDERELGLSGALSACRRGELVVLPTETVYAVATDAFSAGGVARMREALSRPAGSPLPVLVGRASTADGLVQSMGSGGRSLVQAFWPGPLTLVARAHPSLTWDIGDTAGTVTVRMPIHPVAIELLRMTGPLAVTTAALPGLPPPRTVAEARGLIGDRAAVYLDAGPCPEGEASTVVDITGDVPRIVRRGAFPADLLREVVPELEDLAP